MVQGRPNTAGTLWASPGQRGDQQAMRAGDAAIPASVTGAPLVLASVRSAQRREPCGEVPQLPGLVHDAHAGQLVGPSATRVTTSIT